MSLQCVLPPANLLTAAILCRGKCGLTRGITPYMVAMAMTELIVVIFHVLLKEIYIYYNPNSFLSLSTVCPSYIHMRTATMDYSVWLTVSFTFDHFVSICCPKLRRMYCTDRTAAAVIVAMCALSCLKYIPFQFLYEPRFHVDNVNWGCRPKVDYFTSIWWAAFAWMCSVSLSLLPFGLIVLLNGLTVRYIIAASRVRRRLKSLEAKDSEAENRSKSIVLLFTVSVTSILLWTTATVTLICNRVSVNHVSADLTNPSNIANEVGILLVLASCCANTFIYAMTQRKFRQEVKNGIKTLTLFIIKPIKLARQ
ncbi:probable G-protein coupled receptor 139 [Amblyraja radiata]|uniref:probable G-protein coupled receptor 139 n=1 Tax=Amblyraja radiata TaxID=386614 RepID=UPI0014031317|nr:probable G-protein coupled receptor 139 [Amblyraja radiata]